MLIHNCGTLFQHADTVLRNNGALPGSAVVTVSDLALCTVASEARLKSWA